MKRVGATLDVRPECIESYKQYHLGVWPEIEMAIRVAGIERYSIFLFDTRLFAYFEYTGPETEFEARMQALAAAPRMREWWDLMEMMQVPLPGRRQNTWWAEMEEVFHLD